MFNNGFKPRHREIMYQLLAGATQSEIARDLGMSQSRISLIVNSPIFKAEMQALECEHRKNVLTTSESVREVFNMGSVSAAESIVDKITHEDPNISLRAAKEVVEYSDFGRERHSELTKPLVITQQQMVVFEEGLAK